MTAKPSEYFIPQVGIVQVGQAFRLPDGRSANAAFLGGLDAAGLAAIGAEPVVRQPKPAYDPNTESLQEAQDGAAITYQVLPIPPAEIETAIAREAAEGRAVIDVAAEQTRLRFITAGAGQAMVYQAKMEEARRYLAADPAPETLDDYPLIAAEVDITAVDAQAVIAIWQQMEAGWRQVAAAIEAARLGGKAAVAAAAAAGNFAGLALARDTALATFEVLAEQA